MRFSLPGVFRLVSLSALFGLLVSPSVVLAKSSTIDVLVIYTQGVADKYAGSPTTRFNHLIEVANQVYVDSDVGLTLRLVGAEKVSYPDSGSANTALDAITYGRSAFANVSALRERYGADMVLFYRTYQSSHGSCGLAWVNAGSNGDLTDSNSKKYMYAHVGIDTCPDHTTVHELGHNMGLNHSRLQDKTGGVYPYALGYGVAGKFTDVMAYTSSFKVDYWTGTVYKLSNPLITCRGLPCGVDRSKANGADAAFAINLTGPQIANYYGGTVSSLASELSILADRVLQADQLRAEATAALEAQKIVSNGAATALTAAKAAVDALNKQGGKDYTSYKTKLTTLAKAQTTLTTLANAVTKAQTKYSAAVKEAARKTAAKEVTGAQAAYDKQVKKVSTLQSEVDTLSVRFGSLVTSLTTATEKLTTATASAKAEKTKYDALAAAAKNAETNYKTVKAEYDKLLKKLG